MKHYLLYETKCITGKSLLNILHLCTVVNRNRVTNGLPFNIQTQFRNCVTKINFKTDPRFKTDYNWNLAPQLLNGPRLLKRPPISKQESVLFADPRLVKGPYHSKSDPRLVNGNKRPSIFNGPPIF